jgi:hypothetical protein
MKAGILLLSTMLFLLTTGHACAGWLIYHKPAFEGQILDTETKDGIEGAAVVALYYRAYPGIGGGNRSAIHIRETVTDKEGKFHIPSYTTIISPFSWADEVRFIIWKPGYVALQSGGEARFSGGEMTHPNHDVPWLHNSELIFRFREPNIVELPPARSREDRRMAKPAPYGEKSHWRHQRQLIRLIREEYQYLHSIDASTLYEP